MDTIVTHLSVIITRANGVRTAGEAGQVAWRIPAASAAGIVRSGPAAQAGTSGRGKTEMNCASEPHGIAAGAGALPGARRRCEAGKRTHGPGPLACLALLAATALLALAAPAQAQTDDLERHPHPRRGRHLVGILGCSNGVSHARCQQTLYLYAHAKTASGTTPADYNIAGIFGSAPADSS